MFYKFGFTSILWYVKVKVLQMVCRFAVAKGILRRPKVVEGRCVFLWSAARQNRGWECACFCFRFLFFSLLTCHDHQQDLWEKLKEFSFSIILAFHNSYILISLRNGETPLVLSIYFFFDKSLLFLCLLCYCYFWVRFCLDIVIKEFLPCIEEKSCGDADWQWVQVLGSMVVSHWSRHMCFGILFADYLPGTMIIS